MSGTHKGAWKQVREWLEYVRCVPAWKNLSESDALLIAGHLALVYQQGRQDANEELALLLMEDAKDG